MAEKDLEMRRMNADATYTIYNPLTKATNVKMNDGTSVETKVMGHLAEKATEEKLGHVKVDGNTIFINNGVITTNDPKHQYYIEGDEKTLNTGGWVEGFKGSRGVLTKNADSLQAYADGNASVADAVQAIWVTNSKINLNNISRIGVEWENNGSDLSNRGFIQVSNNKDGDCNDKVAETSRVNRWGRLVNHLDVSNLKGEYYIKLGSIATTNEPSRFADTKFYRIWGEK